MEPERLDALLATYAEGTIDPPGMAELQASLQGDPEARRFAARWFDQERQLRAAHAAARQRLHQARRRRILLALAAGLLLALGSLAWLAWPAPALARCLGGARIAERAGSAVRVGDAVQTGDEAGSVVFPDGSRLDLTAHTLLVFPAAEPPLLQAGSLDAAVHPQPTGRTFAVATPHARIDVVGTRFNLAVADGRSRVRVDEGHVRFTDQLAGWRHDLLAGAACSSGASAPPLVPIDARWRIRDHDETAPPAWEQPDFDDAEWRSGHGPFGFGRKVQPVATELDAGSGPGDRRITAYFRHAFAIEDPARTPGLELRYRLDDGMIVYLNGREVLRDNMPPGAVTGTTPAKAVVSKPEQAWRRQRIEGALLPGRNVLAIEVHQHSRASSDLLLAIEAHTLSPHP